jgi:microcystin-dependent protein
MAKTNFIDGNPQQGVQGTIVNAAFLNALNNHRHRGLNQDGDGAIDYAPDTGAANAYVIALTPALTARVVGMPIHFMAANANTGPSTLNDGLGAVDISKNFDQPLVAGDIKAGQFVTVAWDGVNYQMLNQTQAPSLLSGSIIMWPSAVIPGGWLLCDGAAVSRSTYAALFAIINTTFGVGDNSTTFNLPNLKGKVPVGLNSADTEFDVMGETGGEKTHLLTVAEMPAHTHNYLWKGSPTGGGDAHYLDDTSVNTATSSAGGGEAHNNLQPYITLNFIIKT